MNSQRSSKKSGFTLIELLIVVAIIAILAALLLPKSTDQYAGATRDTAKRASENLLNRFGDEVQGIFCPNESTTAGMLSALQDIGKAGKVIFVGFDTSQMFVDAMGAKQLRRIIYANC